LDYWIVNDEIFHKAADISLKKMKTKKRNKVSQKWFDLDLNIMKKKVDEKAKHMSRYPNDPSDFSFNMLINFQYSFGLLDCKCSSLSKIACLN
jgi:hypothetical protein